LHSNIINMIDYNYIVSKVKSRGFKLIDIANKMNVQYQTLNKNLKNGSFDTVARISEVTNIHFVELLPPPEGFTHFYDEQGRWLGIVRKYPYQDKEADALQQKEQYEQDKENTTL